MKSQKLLAICFVWLFGSCYQTEESDIIDLDGNSYHTIALGDQVWLQENLRVTHYRNGDPIEHIPDGAQWSTISTGAYCSYGNDTSLINDYGQLYNWYAINDPRNIAPKGWRIANDEDWRKLINYLGGDTVAGSKMKEPGDHHWIHSANKVNSESGFNALPGGYRFTPGGSFHTLGSNGYWWTTNGTLQLYSWSPRIFFDFANVNRESYYKTYGFSVRCIKE